MSKTNKDTSVEIIVVQNGYIVYLSTSPYKDIGARMVDSGYVAENFDSLQALLRDKLKEPGE